MHFKTALSKNTLQFCSLKFDPSKNVFQKIHVKITPSKNAFQNCYHKDISISPSINAVKGKIGINKSLIMYGPILALLLLLLLLLLLKYSLNFQQINH